MLSGTASWLNLTLMEMLGMEYQGENIAFSPILEDGTTDITYTVTTGKTVIHVHIRKAEGFARVSDVSSFTMDGVPFGGAIKRPDDGKEHFVEIII